jgi:hypothetical protein
MRRQVLSAAAPACLLLGLSPVAAHADVAPGGTATAAAARVSTLVGISTTGASADSNKADAEAAVISIGGKSALGTGGSQSSDGDVQGAILDTGDRFPARLQVAPWHTVANGSKASAHRHSKAEAALARAEAPGVVKVGLLTSQAEADHTATQSNGTSVSDAADLTLADVVRVVLLHSEVGSTERGHSYLVGLNGTEIGTDEQLGKICALDASGVASLSCLTASGGKASNGITAGAAQVAGVNTALGLNPVAAFSTAASSGPGTTPPSILPVAAPVINGETARAAVSPAAAPARTPALPRTGLALASAALLSGLVLRLFGRRRRLAA